MNAVVRWLREVRQSQLFVPPDMEPKQVIDLLTDLAEDHFSKAVPSEELRVYDHCLGLELWLKNQPDWQDDSYRLSTILEGFVCRKHDRHMVQTWRGDSISAFSYMGRRKA